MNILITGGLGFIGSHLCDKLILEGHQVVVIDNLTTGNLENLNSKAKFSHKSINDSLHDIFEEYKFDCVFHLAAQINLRNSIKNPLTDAYTNITGSLNLLKYCVDYKVKRFIFSSTGGAIYSPRSKLPFTEKSKVVPESPYALSKYTVEQYIKMFHKLYALPYTILRYSNVYGPRQNAKGEAGVIAIFIEKMLAGEDLTIFGNGEQTRDFIYVDDVVQANVLALTSGLNGVFNVSSNTQCSVNSLLHKIIITLKITPDVKLQTALLGELAHTQLCADKLMAKGWHPTIPIDKGIIVTANYFLTKNLNKS